MPRAKGIGNAKADTTGKAKNALDVNTPDLFGDLPSNDLAVDFGEVDAKAVHSVVGRVCKLGGYIAFSAPSGGVSVKLTVSVGGSSGQRWNHNGQELANNILHVHKLLEKLEAGE